METDMDRPPCSRPDTAMDTGRLCQTAPPTVGHARPTQLRCRHDHAPLRPIVGVVDPISLGRCGFMNKWHRPPLTSDPTRPRPRHPRPGSSFSSDLYTTSITA